MITLVCTGGEAPPPHLCLRWLGLCQRIMAADGGLSVLRGLGLGADLWIGDGDSLPGPTEDWAPWYRQALRLAQEKDDSDTEAAVRAAVEEGADEVWLVGGSGGRMDHWLANLKLVALQPKVTRWLTSREEAWRLGPGGALAIEPGTVSIFPLGAGPWAVRSQGLKWPVDDLDWDRWHSLSNVAVPGAFLSVVQGDVLVMRPFAEGQEP